MKWLEDDAVEVEAFEGKALLGYEKNKGRIWLENSAASHSQQSQVKAALTMLLYMTPIPIRNFPEISFSGKEPANQDTIEADDTLYPATNSDGERIHPTDEGIRNFWRWFNGFRPERLGKEDGGSENRRPGGSAHDGTAGPWATDDAGRPGLFFYGTDVEIQTFDLDHPNRKDKVWLVRGGYLTSSIYRRKFHPNPASGRFRHPSYGRAHVVAREPGGSS
jgi:hypothetical protein